jgi:hypothetical protein
MANELRWSGLCFERDAVHVRMHCLGINRGVSASVARHSESGTFWGVLRECFVLKLPRPLAAQWFVAMTWLAKNQSPSIRPDVYRV